MRKLMKRFLLLTASCMMTIGIAITAFGAGWEQSGDNWYYRGNSGEYLKNTWVYTDGKNYYLGADGKMLTGEHTIVYRTCKFDNSGALIEESIPEEVAGLDHNDLCWAQKAVQDYWPAIEKGYEMANEERKANGALPTILNYDLCVAAAYRSIEMDKMGGLEGNGPYYSGPDEHGEMLWNTVSRVLTGDAAYIGTENKSASFTQNMTSDRGVSDMERLLRSQFRSPAHYAQIIGKEYGQIGIAIVYTDKTGNTQWYRITEIIKVGEIKPGDVTEAATGILDED